MEEVRLYRRNQLGIGTWRIWYEMNEGETAAMLHYAHSTTLNGAEVSHKDVITTNLSGRNIREQVHLEMRSRIGRQLDKGYKHSLEEARNGLTNQMGFMTPMLAQTLDRAGVPASFKNAMIQRKYDGHRTLITHQDGDIVPYTRRGKPIDTIHHILDEISAMIPEGVTLDGELYIHGLQLQNIGSIIKRKQADNVKLRFHWYDLRDKNQLHLTYAERYAMMNELLDKYVGVGGHTETFEIVPTYPIVSMVHAMEYFRNFRMDGYEGAIVRLDTKPYQDGVRSPSLIKLKEWHDCEVTVLSARPSKEGWAILTCEMDSGKIFDTSAPGSVPEKEEVLRNFYAKYKNRRLTIEYASLTNDGLPFHASALRWREDL